MSKIKTEKKKPRPMKNAAGAKNFETRICIVCVCGDSTYVHAYLIVYKSNYRRRRYYASSRSIAGRELYKRAKFDVVRRGTVNAGVCSIYFFSSVFLYIVYTCMVGLCICVRYMGNAVCTV